MDRFDYSNAPVCVRGDIVAAQQKTWQGIGQPGTWWTGAQRVAIVSEVRNAPSCKLCRSRKEALSPFSIKGVHESTADLPAVAIDVIHRVVTDPGRLTRSWYESALDEGLTDAEYVEVAIVSVLTVAVDTFARAIGSPLWALPEPKDGEPTRVRPEGLIDEGAYVPTIPSGNAGPAEADLRDTFSADIYRSISLVPDQARLFYALQHTHYLLLPDIRLANSNGGRAISRPQIELIAARVSALNGCFF